MSMLEKSWKVQRKIDHKVSGIGKGKYSRVLKMARKPTKEEYIKIVQITGIGIILVGLLGFVIYLILSVYLSLP